MIESYFESIFVIFAKKHPFLSILDTFWANFGHFSYTTGINDALTIELNYLLNWISRIFLNWIIFWIESWVKQYWIKYKMNHFLAKFKHWIESDRVSNALAIALLWLLDLYIYTAGGGNPLYRAELLKQCKKAKNITKKLMKTLRKVPKKFYFRHFFCVLVIYIYIGSQFWKKLDLACF